MGLEISRSAKLLIVDEEELIRLNLRALLEDLGYRITEAANGREGLDAFDRDGPTWSRIQDIGMFDEGTDFVRKPFDKNVLLRKVREILDV